MYICIYSDQVGMGKGLWSQEVIFQLCQIREAPQINGSELKSWEMEC